MSAIAAAWAQASVTLSVGGKPEFILLQTAPAWRLVTHYLDPAAVSPQHASREWPPETTKALEILAKGQLADDLLSWYFERVRASFGLVQADVLAFLDQYDAAQAGEERVVIVSRLLNQIGNWLQVWQRPVVACWPTDSPLAGFRRTFLSSLYEHLPPRFSLALTTYLRSLLHSATTLSADPAYPLAIPTLLFLLERYDPILFGLIYEEIEQKVERDCRGEYGEPMLADLIEWLNVGVLGWVSGIYGMSVEGGQEEAKKMLKPTFSRFEYHVHKTLGSLRTAELFDIIVDYPASKPALEDLKSCLYKADQRALLVSRLRGLTTRRLLTPGADTKDIITQYISTIRCLRIVDPQGVLLSRVAEPIRRYLRSREDTIRCIVSSLIDEDNDLVGELAASDARPVHDARDEAENFNDPNWTPDPIDAPPDFRKSKGSDVIQLLVSIYDTKDVFVKELQVLLAQRLLAIKNYELEKEIKNVEILKIRFGEASLQGCEVMIKDLQDSKRIDHYVHEDRDNLPLHATIVSRLFWPSFKPAPLKLPGRFGRVQAEYEQSFAHHKPDKKLRWLPQLGTANITVDLKDRSLTVDVTAVQAALIELFSQQATWTSDDLAAELRVTDLSAIRNGLYFWNNLGVLKNLGSDEWTLLEEADTSADAGVSHVIEETVEAVQSVQSQQVEQMRIYWHYIQAMLTNLGAQSLSSIQSKLNMFVPDFKSRTKDELLAFLEAMVVEGLVEKSGTSWKIVK